MAERDDTAPDVPGGPAGGEDAGRDTSAGGGEAPSDRTDDADAPKERTPVQRVLRAAAIALAGITGAVLIIAALFVLALQTNWGGTHFADFLITLANPFSEAQTEYDELRGNFLTRIEMRDLRMYRMDTVYVDTVSRAPLEVRYVRKDSIGSPEEIAAFDTLYVDTLQMAVIDTFRMRYNPLSLLRKEVHFKELYFANPVLRARQRPDSTWDLVAPFSRDTVEAGEAAFTFRIDSLNVTDGELFAIFDPPDPDSVLEVRNFNIRGGDVRIAETISARIDTLFASYSPPGHKDWTEVRASGRLLENELNLAGLELESPRSFVTASGRLHLPTDDGEEIDNIDFELRADPISFQDLHPFIPALRQDRSATLDVTVGGSSSLMHVDASGQFSDGSSFSLTGAVSPTGRDRLTYRAEGRLKRFDPSFFTGEGDASTLVNAEFDVDLSGTDLDALDGLVVARLSPSRVGGLELSSSRIRANFAGGEADVELAASFDGSTVSAEGTVRPFADTPSYRLTGRTSNFNLASLGAEEQQSDIDATFTVEGYGFDPTTAEIDGDLQVHRSSINNYVVESGTVRFELADGRTSYGMRFLFPDGLLVANGNARFDDPVTFSVSSGRFENVDLAALLGQDGPSSINGRFTLEGVGTDPQAMTLDAALDMDRSTFGTYVLQDGRIAADLGSGVLRLTASADMAEAGRFDLAAVTRPFDDRPVLRVTQANFVNVDVGAFAEGGETSTDLNGTASFNVLGFDTGTMRLDGTVSLSQSRINAQTISSAALELGLAGGTLTFDGNIDVPEGSVDLTGTAQPFEDVPTYEISQGTFQNIDLAAFTGNPSLESSLDGSLSITGSGLDPETLSIQGRVELAGSRINEQQIDAASVEGMLEGGVFNVDVSLSVPEGDTRLSGTFRPFLETPTYTVTEGSFAGINIGALTGNPDWQTNLAGSLSVTGSGLDPQTMQVRGTVELEGSRINDVTLRRGTITGSIDDGFADFDANLAFDDGSAVVRGQGRLFADVPTYALQGTLSNVQLGELLATDTLAARVSGAFDLEGEGTDPRTMSLRGRFTSGDAYFEGAELDTLYTDFDMSGGVVRVDSLLLRSTAVDASGSGIIALYDTTATSNFRFTADLKDVHPVRSLVAAENLTLEEGHLEGRVYGPPGSLRFDATGTLTNVIYNNIRLGEFEGTLAGEIQPDSGVTIAEVRGDLQSISIPQLLIDEADLNLTYTQDRILFDGIVRIDEGRTGQVAGFIETAPDARRIVLDSLSLTLDGDEWELLQRATITYGEAYRVSNLLLYSGDQQLAVDGIVDPDGQQNLIVTIESVQMGAVADLLGYEGLGGPISGSLVLTGPADAPDMTGTLTADISSYDQEVGDLRLALDYGDLRLNLDAVLTHVDGSTLSAEGYVPLDLRVAKLDEGVDGEDLAQGRTDLTITAESFAMGWIEPFLNPETVDEFEGRLTADVQVGGTMSSPIVDGSAQYSEGRIGLPDLGLEYDDIQADFTLDQNQVQVSEIVIRSGDGLVRGDGTVNLAELTLGEFDIDLQADDFLAIDSREYQFVVDGDMRLSGTTTRPVLSGDVEVVSGEILLSDETTSAELEPVRLSDQAIQTVERRFGVHVTERDTTTFSLYQALAMDLDVSIERNTWLRSRVNPIMDIQFSGDLDLVKDNYQDINIFGTIEVVPQRSRIVQFGKRFDITSGTLTFQGPAGDPLIDIEAEYEVRQFGQGGDFNPTITLAVEGRMSEQLDLTLGSVPQMEYANIVSYIATGYPAGPQLNLGGQALFGAGTSLAVGQLTALMEGIAEAGLGLDVVTLEQEAGQTVLTGGTYVTPRLFVSVSQPISDIGGATPNTPGQTNRPIFTVEYEITNWLLGQLTQRNQILRLNLQFEYAY